MKKDMNENLDLVEILKNCLKGTKLWTSIFGEAFFDGIDEKNNRINIIVPPGSIHQICANGSYSEDNNECIIFPSRTQRDWDLYKVPTKRFDPYSFQPFDKILILVSDEPDCPFSYIWRCDIFSYVKENTNFLFPPLLEIGTTSGKWRCVIPYNDETKHLVGTHDDCPEYYKWWLDDKQDGKQRPSLVVQD